MAEIHECEHMQAITLGPEDHIAVIVPAEVAREYNRLADALESWWPEKKVLVLDHTCQIVAVVDGEDR